MAQIVKELRVDVSQPNVFQAIVAKQHDSNSRFLKITLVDFGVKVEVPNTAKVTINANRPDGASESFKGEANNDGTITVPLAQWMLDVDGEVKCDVSVTNTEDNKRLTSTDFWLEVQKAANPNASIPLDPDGEILIIKPVSVVDENSKDTDYPSAKAVYDYGQNIAADTQITATATGSAITINPAEAPFAGMKLFGKTTQNGTPTPDNPIELKSVGDSGSFEVVVGGENLYTQTPNKQIKLENTIPLNKTITVVSMNGLPITETSITFQNSSQSTIGTYKFNGTSKSVQITNTYGEIGTIIIFGNGQPLFVTTEDIQTLTMPYLLPSMPNLNLKDEVDFTKGSRTQNVGTCIINANSSVSVTGTFQSDIDNNFNTVQFAISLGGLPSASSNDTQIACSHFEGVCNYGRDVVGGFSGNTNILVRIPKSYLADVSTSGKAINSMKSWLSDKTITAYYKLKTPIETALTEQELNAYRHLMTNKGNTTILSEADMEVDYYINKPNAQAIGNIHSQVNADYFKLQQAIISTGGSTL